MKKYFTLILFLLFILSMNTYSQCLKHNNIKKCYKDTSTYDFEKRLLYIEEYKIIAEKSKSHESYENDIKELNEKYDIYSWLGCQIDCGYYHIISKMKVWINCKNEPDYLISRFEEIYPFFKYKIYDIEQKLMDKMIENNTNENYYN